MAERCGALARRVWRAAASWLAVGLLAAALLARSAPATAAGPQEAAEEPEGPKPGAVEPEEGPPRPAEKPGPVQPPDPAIQKLHAELKAKNPDYKGDARLSGAKGAITCAVLAGCRIRDLSPLRGLPLGVLNCMRTEVSDLSPLKGMPLEELFISGLAVRDLSPLRGCPLRRLDCSRTQASDLLPLKGMPLQVLLIAGLPVRDLSPLRGLPLRMLDCSQTQVSDLSPLKGMPLVELHLDGLPVRDLSPLRGLRLTKLSCAKTQVADLSPLEGMPLEDLQINGPTLRDLSPLRNLPLRRLVVSLDDIAAGVSALGEHKTLGLMEVRSPGGIERVPLRAFWLWQGLKQGGFRLAATLPGHTGAVDSVAILAGGSWITSAGRDGRVRFWDGATGEPLDPGRAEGLSAPPKGDAADRQRLLEAFGRLADGLGAPPKGDAAGRQRLLEALGRHAEGVTAVAASADGRRIVTGSADGAVRLWAIGPPDPIEEHRLDESAHRRLAAAMGKKVSFDFVETPLQDVVNFLSSLVDVTIVLDPEAVKEDTPNITLRVKEMPLRDALGRICDQAKMVHHAHDGALLVTTVERAKLPRGPLEELRALQWPQGVRETSNLHVLVAGISFDFVETPYQDVLAFIASLCDVPIFPDHEAFKDGPTNVTLRVNDMRFHNAMRWVCRCLGKVFIWHDGALWVTTPQRARGIPQQEKALAALQDPPTPELARKMEKAISFDFVETPLQDALSRLSRDSGVPVLLEAEGAKGKPVELHAKGLPMDRALRWVCRSVGLAHVWRGPEIVVTEPEHARDAIGTEADNPVARRLHTELKAANPHYKRDAAFRFRGGELEGLGLRDRRVSDLSPLKGLRLKSLDCRENHIADLAPLAGVPLQELDCSENRVADLSPLRGMPLKRLACAKNQVRDLSPMAGMPLEQLDCRENPVADLTPLRGLPLRRLECSKTQVTDLSPLNGMPLEELGLSGLAIRGLAPLLGLPLKRLAFSHEKLGGDLSLLEKHKTLECVGFDCELDGATTPVGILRLLREAELGTRRLAATLTGHQGAVDSLFVSSDGARIISAGRDGTVRVWDGATGECAHINKGFHPPIQLALSWDGKFLYSRDADGAAKLWDPTTGRCLKSYAPGSKDEVFGAKTPDKEKLLQALGRHAEGVGAIAASPDGNRIVAGSADGAIRVWVIGPPDPIEEHRLDEPWRKQVAARMQERISFELAGMPLDEAVPRLHDLVGLPVVLDHLEGDAPKITVRGDNVPVGDALKRVCDAAGMAHVAYDGAILLTTPQRAKAVRGSLEEMRPHQWPQGKELAPWIRLMWTGVTVEFIETPLQDVLAFLSVSEEAGAGIPILLDPQAVADEPRNVNLRVEGMRFEHVLRWACRLAGVVYIWRDGGVYVATPERAERMLRQDEALAGVQKPPTAELAAKMGKAVSFDFVEEPLQKALSQLSKETGVPIVLAAEAAKDKEKPVTLLVKEMPVDRALRWLCRAVELACVWRDGQIVVTTPEAARR